MTRGQISLEFLVIIAVMTLTLTPLLLLVQWNSQQSPDQNMLNKAAWSATRLASSVDAVGSLGPGSQMGVQVEMPDVVNVTAQGREITIRLITSYGPVDAVYPTRFNVTGVGLGSIHKEGSYLIDVSASTDPANANVTLTLR